jgi:hypothetical protein
VAALKAFRSSAAQDVAYWAQHRALGRFAKEEQRRTQRLEKAATLWLRFYTEIGRRACADFPVEMAAELDAAYGALYLAEVAP